MQFYYTKLEQSEVQKVGGHQIKIFVAGAIELQEQERVADQQDVLIFGMNSQEEDNK
jgi:hypothetical protein